MLGDQKRLVQTVTNLLNNASKYTPDGGAIQLRVDVDEHDVRLHVQDNGIGISPELQTHIFDLFAQAERSSDRSQGGLGLGLALVRSLVELHGGTVSCFSAGLGHGSRFTITLPRLVDHHLQADPQAAASLWQAPSRKLSILVVDDNVDAADSLAAALALSGHTTQVAYDALAALAAAVDFRPEVALLDLGLPHMDGFELAGRLRSQPAGERMRIVAVSGYGQTADRERTREAGFDGHFTKPVALEALLAVINTLDS